MATVGIAQSLGLGNFSFGSMGLWASLLVIFFVVLVVFALLGGLIILIVWNKSYNQKITLWANTDGVPQEIATYKAKWIKIHGKHSNERLMFIRSVARWELPRLMAGKNTWHFWRREQDGEWINVLPENVDEKTKKMNIKFLDGDVRMQRIANEKVLRDRLQKKKNWMEIIAQVGYIIVFIFLIIGLVVLFTQLKSLSDAMSKSANAIEHMAVSVNDFYQGKGLSPNEQNPDSAVLTPVNSGGT